MNGKKLISWLLRIVAAIILLQTLFFKFTGSKESVELFTKLVGNEYETYVRIGTGFVELIASILLLIPRTAFVGALLGIGLMTGAVLSHLLVIGIQSQGDGGQLFLYAILVFVCCFLTLLIEKQQGIILYKNLIKA